MPIHNFEVNNIHNFNTLRSLARVSGGLSAFCINARRICHRKKFAKFVNYVDSFNEKPQLLAVTETWFKCGETGELGGARKPIRLYDIDGYQGHFSSREKHSAGIAFYVIDGVDCEVIEKSNGNVSYIHAKLRLASGERLYVTVFYMPRIADYPDLLEILERLIQSIPHGCKHMIMGDFNINVGAIDGVSQAYLDLLATFGYAVTNDKVTFPRSQSIIDHIVTNFDQVVNYTIGNDFSDHNGVLSVIDGATIGERVDTPSLVRKVIDFPRLKSVLADKFSDTTRFTRFGAQGALQCFVDTLSASVDACSRETSGIKLKPGSKPWTSQSVARLSGAKKRIRNRLDINPNNDRLQARLEEIEQEIRLEKRRAKKSYIHNQFTSGSSNSKSCWAGINCVLGREKTNVVPNRIMVGRARVVTGAAAVAEELNKAFVDPIEIPQVSQRPNSRQNLNWSMRSMLLLDATVCEVFSFLSKLEVHKATGPDGLSNYILKKCAPEMAEALTICINKSLSTGIYPGILKTARVTPVFKGGSKEIASNYRPISVLSALNKIYESVLASRIKGFLKKEGLIYNHQYGFRDKSGTATAALEMLDFVYQNLDQKNCAVVSALFLDLRKAFDTVSHPLLLRKLYAYGIRGPAHDILASYLSDRSQFTSVCGVNSPTLPVTQGVPQGSVLGPILFLIFLNDVASLSLHGKLFLYADDACLVYPGANDVTNCVNMNSDLEVLSHYFSLNRLSLNVTKTKFMHMHTGRKTLLRSTPVLYQGELVEEVQVFCYLGLYIDSLLTWRHHTDHLCTKLARMVGVFYRIRDEIPRYALMRLYYALVHSHLMYMVTVWANASETDLKRLQTLQNRMLKVIHRLPLLTPTVELYRDHVKSVLPIKGLQMYVACKFVRETLTHSTYHTMEFTTQPGAERLRNSDKLSRTQPLSSWGLLRMAYQGPTFYNAIPRGLRQISSNRTFHIQLKQLLLTESSLKSLVRCQTVNNSVST